MLIESFRLSAPAVSDAKKSPTSALVGSVLQDAANPKFVTNNEHDLVAAASGKGKKKSSKSSKYAKKGGGKKKKKSGGSKKSSFKKYPAKTNL